MKRTILLDGDIVVHKIASACEEATRWDDDLWTYHANEDEAKSYLDNHIQMLMDQLECDKVVVALTDFKKNFRKLVNPDYKANRVKTRKPILFKTLISYLRNHYRTFILNGLEADDVLGVLATYQGELFISGDDDDPIVVSTDKDLTTIPCVLFNPDKDGFPNRITEEEANYNFYTQVLTGDATDNYRGCPKIGPQTAEKLLEKSDDYWQTIVTTYAKAGLDESEAIMQARMARILRAEDFNLKSESVVLWQPNIKK